MQKKTVLLFGGFSGWFNFGDFAQLKSWLFFYENKGCTSFILLNKNCISNQLQYAMLKECFGENLIFYEDGRFYDHSLNVIDKSNMDFFHVYGGGFLNIYWGKNKIEIMERAIKFFKPKKYFITGQQISREFILYLKNHIEHFEPNILAVRDKESLKLCNDINMPVFFSFDDSTEYFDNLRNNLDLRVNKEEKNIKTLLLHINLSYYVLNNEDDIWGYRDKIKELISQYDRIYFLKAYQSYDIEVKDTFRAIDYLYLTLEKASGIFIDLMAILQKEKYWVLKDIIGGSNNILTITNSYHTALFSCFMGIPSWLIRLNPYYKHKANELFEDIETSHIWGNLLDIKEKQQKKLRDLIHERKKFLEIFEELIIDDNKEHIISYGEFTYISIPEKLFEKVEIDGYVKKLMKDIEWFRQELENMKYYADRLKNKIRVLESEIDILRFERDELKSTLHRIYNSRGWRFLSYYYNLKHRVLSKLGIIRDGN